MAEAKYTWGDIIIDPTSDRAKEAVGKQVYYSQFPNVCLLRANNDDRVLQGILISIDPKNSLGSFIVDGSPYACIIVKKEEPKPKHKSKYIPYQITTRNLAEYWEKLKGRAFIIDDEECTLIEAVTRIYKDFDAKEADINEYSVSMLCDEARWLDTGEPVGEEIEDE